MRQLILVLISLILLSGSLIATVGTLQLRDYELRGYVDPTVDQNLPFLLPRPGVNVDLRQYEPDSLSANLSLISESGFVWLRQFVYWDEIETRRGQYDWTRWDDIFDVLREYTHLEPVIVLMNTPVWARVKPPGVDVTETAPPQSLDDFARFAGAFARRYGDLVDYYQIWDEPNLDDAWGSLQPRPVEYVALLAAGQESIRRADPAANIIAAALAPTTETGGQNISDLLYLDAMYQLGAAELMDIVAGKPYGFSTSPLDRRVEDNLLNFSRIVALREIMLAHDDGRTPLWASNWGWNALPSEWTGDASIWGSVTSGEQISFTLQAFDRAHREFPWLGAMFLHHWQPNVDSESAQWGFALARQDDGPSELLAAVQRYPFPAKAQNGLYHARTQHARYSGVWQFSELGADIGWLETSDSQFEFDFYGTDLAMLLREDDYVAFLYPAVDGVPANATARDSDGNSYIFLRSYSRSPEKNLISIARDLSLGPHTLSAVADRGWDRWAIAGYAVSSGNLAADFDRQIALGIVAILLSLPLVLLSFMTAPWRRWIPPIGLVFAGVTATAHLAISSVASLALLFAMLWTWTSHRPGLLLRDEINILVALATGGILYLTPSFLLTIVSGLVLFVLCFHRLETGLILTLFWAPFFLSPVELYQFAIPMVEILILITSVAAFFRLLAWLGKQYQMANSDYPLRAKALRDQITLIDITVAAMAVVAILSLSWSNRLDVATNELRTLIFEPLLFYIIFRVVRPSRRTILHCIYGLVAASLIVSVIGLLKFFAGNDVIVAEEGARRLISVYGSPNNVGLLLGRAIPFALALLLVGQSLRLRFTWAAALLIMGITALLTQSVGAILLGIPLGIAVVLIGYAQRKAFIPILGIGAAGLAGIALLTQVSARFANILDFTSGTSFLRLRLWESTIEIILNHPISGIGLDQFLYFYSGEYVRPDAIWDLDLSHPHNFVLDLWTRLGIAGPILFLILQGVFWRYALLTLSRTRNSDSIGFAIVLGLMGSMTALLAHGLIDNSIFVIDLAFIFMFLLAATVRLGGLTPAAASNSDPENEQT